MIKLASLIKLHDGYTSEKSLPRNLGDGFLYSRNMFFSVVRDWATETGLQFSSEASPIWQQYQALAFFSLQDIFDQQVVPYVDNVTVFKNVLKRDPSLAVPLRFITDTLKKNYILHESAHYVAYRRLMQWRGLDGAPPSDKEWFVAYCLLSECVARVVERFAVLTADSDFHRIMLHFNAYPRLSDEDQKIFDRACSVCSMPQLFYLALMMALWSNITGDNMPPGTRRRFFNSTLNNAANSGMAAPEINDFTRLFMSVNADFRESTTRSFFRLYKCEQEFERSLSTMIDDENRLAWLSECFHALVKELFDRIEVQRANTTTVAPIGAKPARRALDSARDL